jgi:hypothetical protein
VPGSRPRRGSLSSYYRGTSQRLHLLPTLTVLLFPYVKPTLRLPLRADTTMTTTKSSAPKAASAPHPISIFRNYYPPAPLLRLNPSRVLALPLFTGLPRRLIRGNSAPGIGHSRKPPSPGPIASEPPDLNPLHFTRGSGPGKSGFWSLLTELSRANFLGNSAALRIDWPRWQLLAREV